MDTNLIPGDAPYGASALILHESGLVLAVSRKHDHTDLGLPGGKLEQDQNFMDALIAEVAQETGLEVLQAEPFFGNYCGIPGIHKIYWTLTFMCKVQGYIHTQEQGKVLWVNRNRLIFDPTNNMKTNSFSEYNQQMLVRLNERESENKKWINHIVLDPKHVDSRW